MNHRLRTVALEGHGEAVSPGGTVSQKGVVRELGEDSKPFLTARCKVSLQFPLFIISLPHPCCTLSSRNDPLKKEKKKSPLDGVLPRFIAPNFSSLKLSLISCLQTRHSVICSSDLSHDSLSLVSLIVFLIQEYSCPGPLP